MDPNIALVLYFLAVADRKLNAILSYLQTLAQQGAKMTAELQALTDQVAKNTNVEASAVALIQGIAAQLAAAKQDPAQITALAGQLKTSADALAAAVAANTVAAPATP